MFVYVFQMQAFPAPAPHRESIWEIPEDLDRPPSRPRTTMSVPDVVDQHVSSPVIWSCPPPCPAKLVWSDQISVSTRKVSTNVM